MSLPMDSSKEDIRKQYRRLCLLWHPDKSGEESESDRARFEELQMAHRFLLDDNQREEYDFGLWKDRPVRHHTKKRDKVRDSWDDRKPSEEEEDAPRHHYNWGDRHLIEDDKVQTSSAMQHLDADMLGAGQPETKQAKTGLCLY
ncbi:dnaJ [Symbiodinium sp. CCMP2592]|nr:dnaJ [Symbiodinium sp. CCMP2592]